MTVNAAMGEDELLTQVTSEKLSQYLATNVEGAHGVVNPYLPALQARKTPRFMCISSTAAFLTKQVGERLGPRGLCAMSKAVGEMMSAQFQRRVAARALWPKGVLLETPLCLLARPRAIPAQESGQNLMENVDSLTLADRPNSLILMIFFLPR